MCHFLSLLRFVHASLDLLCSSLNWFGKQPLVVAPFWWINYSSKFLINLICSPTCMKYLGLSMNHWSRESLNILDWNTTEYIFHKNQGSTGRETCDADKPRSKKLWSSPGAEPAFICAASKWIRENYATLRTHKYPDVRDNESNEPPTQNTAINHPFMVAKCWCWYFAPHDYKYSACSRLCLVICPSTHVKYTDARQALACHPSSTIEYLALSDPELIRDPLNLIQWQIK